MGRATPCVLLSDPPLQSLHLVLLLLPPLRVVQATNVVTVTPTGAAAVTASATATLTVTGCSGSAAVTIGNIQPVVINTYTW